MYNIRIYVNIPVRTAVELGSAVAGVVALSLTDEHAATIRDRSLLEAAEPYLDETRQAGSRDLECNLHLDHLSMPVPYWRSREGTVTEPSELVFDLVFAALDQRRQRIALLRKVVRDFLQGPLYERARMLAGYFDHFLTTDRTPPVTGTPNKTAWPQARGLPHAPVDLAMPWRPDVPDGYTVAHAVIRWCVELVRRADGPAPCLTPLNHDHILPSEVIVRVEESAAASGVDSVLGWLPHGLADALLDELAPPTEATSDESTATLTTADPATVTLSTTSHAVKVANGSWKLVRSPARWALVRRRGTPDQVKLEALGHLPEIQLDQLEDADAFALINGLVNTPEPIRFGAVRVVAGHPILRQQMWPSGHPNMPAQLAQLSEPIRKVAELSRGKVRVGNHWVTSGSRCRTMSVEVEADSVLGNTLSREYYWVVGDHRLGRVGRVNRRDTSAGLADFTDVAAVGVPCTPDTPSVPSDPDAGPTAGEPSQGCTDVPAVTRTNVHG